MTTVAQVTTAHYAFAVRIFRKQCVSLARAGYDVHLLAPHDRDETVEGVHLHGFPKARGKGQRAWLSLWVALRRCLAMKAAVYHFHDPELIPMALVLKLAGRKVVYDAHENWHLDILNKRWIGPMWARRLASRAALLLEKLGSACFDATVTVLPEIAAKFPPDRTILVRNTIMLPALDATKVAPVEKSGFALIYPGTIDRDRGIKEVIDSLAHLRNPAELWLFGKFKSEAFRKECEASPGWAKVRYLGYRPSEEIFAHMKAADLGIQVFHDKETFVECYFDTKLFEYMACGIPFITIETPQRRDLYQECAAFVDYRPLRPQAIAEAIDRLLDDPDARKRMGAVGRDLVERDFCWARDEEALLNLYRGLTGGPR